MHKFEVPYNQREDFFDYLAANEDLREYIASIYTPAYQDDAENTRKHLLSREYAPKSFEEYCEHIKRIQDAGYDVNILMQRGATFEAVVKYYRLGIRIFTIADEALAKNMKDVYDDVTTICSITRCLKFNEFFDLDLSMYDIIVLPFCFNRWLNGIKKLPTKYKYMLLANSTCCAYCEHAEEHWFNDLGTGMKCFYENDPYAMVIEIQPDHLAIFDPYIYMYKLVDREAPSESIFRALRLYSQQSDTYNAYEDWLNINRRK